MNRVRNLTLAIMDTQKQLNQLQLQRLKAHTGELILIEPPIMQPNNESPFSEPDYEGDMAMTELAAIADKAIAIRNMINENTELPAWLQSKITLASHNITAAHDYIKYGRK